MLIASRPSRASFAGKLFVLAALTGAFVSASACSSDTSPGSGDGGGNSSGGSGGTGAGGSSGDAGGACSGLPSKGTNDATHCKADDGGAIEQATGACVSDTADAGPLPAGDAGADEPDYGTTLYGTEGDDDDCKYHVKYTVAPICENEGTSFEVTVTRTVDGKPVTGASPYIEATLDDLPASVADKQKPTEKAGGVYDIGPIVFDKAGKWVVRFHFFEDCSDTPEDSPHGHIAFYFDIP
jgi:hypothetical protein